MKLFKSIIILSLFSLIISSCRKDDEPTSSDADKRVQYIGTWVCAENSQTFGTSTYQTEISLHDTEEQKIIISNFNNLGFAESNAVAIVRSNTIEIPQQVIATGFTINGNGFLQDKNTIQINYTTNDGGNMDNVSATYIIQ